MKILKLAAASALLMTTLSACGGGGGSASIPITVGGGDTTPTVVSGIATKGPFKKDSVVKVYSLVNGVKGTLVGQAVLADDSGTYSADLGSYTGPIMVEVSGSYLDEATGNTVAVPQNAPLRAALPAAQGAVTLPVTPLTEMAVVKTGGTLTPASIAAANTMVSDAFKFDIVGTVPVAPTADALSHITNPHQQDYTLALAAISQMASTATGATDTEKIQSVLATLGQGISSSGMASETTSAFHSALTSFVTENANNKTGVNDTAAAGGLAKVGMTTKSYTLTLEGTPTPAGAIQFDLALPTGVSIDVKSMSGQMLSSGSLALSHATDNSFLATHYSPGGLTVGIISTDGIAAGAFATLSCAIPAGSTPPPGSAFVVSNLKVVDVKESTVTGAAVTVN